MYYIIPQNYLIAFSFSWAMPDKVNIVYGTKVSDFQLRARPMGSKEIFYTWTLGLSGLSNREIELEHCAFISVQTTLGRSL